MVLPSVPPVARGVVVVVDVPRGAVVDVVEPPGPSVVVLVPSAAASSSCTSCALSGAGRRLVS